MAQVQTPTTGVKRGPGRPPRTDSLPFKKAKIIETPASSPSVQSPLPQSPATDARSNRVSSKLHPQRPLPTLPQPQSPSLPTSTHQSLAASAVLQASLERSRLRWVHDGIFERYWTKPESGKNARPPPPGNPEAKWMKHRGPCRIRVEPHIFEADLYVEERPKPAPPKPQQQYGYGGAGYGQPYRQGPGQQSYSQQRAVQPMQPQNVSSPAPRPQQSTPQPQQEKKPGQDPVITMLAARASSNPELKVLMKEVATGNATQEQLKVFQGHIDDLTKIIAEQKKQDEADEAAAQAKKAEQQQQDVIQYDGATQPSQKQPAPQPFQPQQPSWQPTPVAPQPPQAPLTHPIVLQFTTPGASEDRFLFPQHSILESLSSQHLLCSFIATRKGRHAADTAGLSPDTDYYQPVTFMVEVAYGRENLIELVKKWVKPADEVRAHMKEVMERCTRAPEAWLALRLPVKGAEGTETEEEKAEDEVKVVEERRKSGPNVKYMKKPPALKKEASGKKTSTPAGKTAVGAPGTEKKDGIGTAGEAVAPIDVDEAKKGDGEETGRPKRAVRKSVRISVG